MKSTGSIEIDCPIEEVYRLTSEDVVEWSEIVVEDEVIEEKPEGAGTTFRTVTEERGKRMEFFGVVSRCDPPHLHACEMTGEHFDIESEFVFEKLGPDKTRVTQRASAKGKGFFKWMMLLFGPMMNKSHCEASKRELESLKAYCESNRKD